MIAKELIDSPSSVVQYAYSFFSCPSEKVITCSSNQISEVVRAVLCAATVSRSLQWKKDRAIYARTKGKCSLTLSGKGAGLGAFSASSSQVVWMKWQEIFPAVLRTTNQPCGFPGALQFLVLVQQVLWLQHQLFYRSFQEVTGGFLWLQLLLLGTTVMHKLVRTKSGLDCSWAVSLRRFLLQQMVIVFYQTLQN